MNTDAVISDISVVLTSSDPDDRVLKLLSWLSYPRKTNVFEGILELACLSVSLSARPSAYVCPSVYKILLSVKVLTGVSSHIQ